MLITSGKLLDSIGNQSVVERVIDRITGSILSGELKRGEKIPTEIELNANLNVSRNTVREAIKVLVYMGVLEIRRADGTYVANGFSDKMLNPLIYNLIIEDGESGDLIELRNMFEVSITKIAIEKATADDLEKIREVCDILRDTIETQPGNLDKIMEYDVLFHRAVCDAAHNPLISQIHKIIAQITFPSRIKTSQKILDIGASEFLITSHENIYQIIRNKEINRVIEVVDESFRYWKDTIRCKEKGSSENL